jgi:DNA mismatch endonuclease (patch repair protein)
MPARTYPKEKDQIKVPRFKKEEGFTTTAQRSRTMSKIKGKNSIPEMLLRRALWARNIRYRIHRRDLPGRPDIVIEKFKLAIFVDGDFWHGYNWAIRKPKSNQAYWNSKIERNMQKDRWASAQLEENGYTMMRFWEHEVKKNLESCINQVILYIEAAGTSPLPDKVDFDQP